MIIILAPKMMYLKNIIKIKKKRKTRDKNRNEDIEIPDLEYQIALLLNKCIMEIFKTIK